MSRRFAYPPNLVVVDGGQPQANAAQAVLDDLGISDVTIVGLAKRLEEVWVPGEQYPLILPRTSEALYLLPTRARRGPPLRHHLPPPEAFEVHGRLGPGRRARPRVRHRRKALMTHFGSLARLRRADVERDHGRARDRPVRPADAILARRCAATTARPEPALNTATGETRRRPASNRPSS